MGVIVLPSSTGMTPICNECGVCLCWDISSQEYFEAEEFWDAWICQDCNKGVRLSLKQWQEDRKVKLVYEKRL